MAREGEADPPCVGRDNTAGRGREGNAVVFCEFAGLMRHGDDCCSGAHPPAHGALPPAHLSGLAVPGNEFPDPQWLWSQR